MISHKKLLKILEYNHLTGIFTWKIRSSYCLQIGDIAGGKDKDGYIEIGINRKKYKAHRLAWFYVYGYWPENMIDHKDQITNHNWISNLREVSRQCNSRNKKNQKNNTSGVKGVYWDKQVNKWKTIICVNQKMKSIGIHKDFDEAICHRLAAEQCLDWNECDSNSPAFQYVKENIQGDLS